MCPGPVSASRALRARSQLQVLTARRGVPQEGRAACRTSWPTTMAALAADGMLYMAVLLCCCEAAASLPLPRASPLAWPVGGSGIGGQEGARTGSRGRGGRPSTCAGGLSGQGPLAARCDRAPRTCVRTVGCRYSSRGRAAEVRGWVVLGGSRRARDGLWWCMRVSWVMLRVWAAAGVRGRRFRPPFAETVVMLHEC